MVSRDTLAHLGALAVAVALVVLIQFLVGTPPETVGRPDLLTVLVAAGWGFIVLAGAHLYLASRGVDGIVPTATRWRFVAVVAACVVLYGLGILATSLDPIVGIRPEWPVFAGVVGLFLGWFLYEARAGYRERRRSV